MDFYVERELYIGNTYFKHRRLHKYTRVSKWIGGKEHDKSGAVEEGYTAYCTMCRMGAQ